MFIKKDKNTSEQPVIKPAAEPVDPKWELHPVRELEIPNPLIGMYDAVKEMLLEIPSVENDPSSPPLFKTVKLDNGQFIRLKKKYVNTEYAVAMPAVFIHYIDVHYAQGQTNIGEGKATMRLHYILSRMNNSDYHAETEGFEVFRRINTAIQANKHKYDALSRRFQLGYWEQPLTFDQAMQAYWIDYEVTFLDYSGYAYRNYVKRYLVVPPFTDHSDQNPECNTEGHDNHDDICIDDRVDIVTEADNEQ